jgi:Ni2+-binding GTPase involved in maturation of urease and hydrogenase
MKLHLVGGFLGSGKTTGIIHAAKFLMERGLQVGVITNDQGKYLVDTAFFRLADLPAVEVTGGCFCCNYDDLDSRLSQLIESSKPDVIFAESVGSCADIVATVVKPLLELGRSTVKPTSFSVFTDGRLLRRRLLGLEMPFSDDVVYIFDKQLEEAGLIIVNKVDLLADLAVEEVRIMLKERYPGKTAIFQNALTPAGVQPWVELVQAGNTGLPAYPLEIDYARYGAGEAQLAWLDEEVTLHVPAGQGRVMLRQIMTRLTSELAERRAGIGHLKFIINGKDGGSKLSFTTLEEPGWEKNLPEIQGAELHLLVNARVEMDADLLKAVFHQVLNESGCTYTLKNSAAFHPGLPKPTHRMG